MKNKIRRMVFLGFLRINKNKNFFRKSKDLTVNSKCFKLLGILVILCLNVLNSRKKGDCLDDYLS